MTDNSVIIDYLKYSWIKQILSSQEKQEELVEQMETSTNQSGETEAPPPAENKPSVASMPLPPYDPNTPIGEDTF